MKIVFIFLLELLHIQSTFAQSGLFDPSFGEEGVVTKKVNIILQQPTASCIAPDKKTILCIKDYYGFSETVHVLRVNQDGTVDSSFGTNGSISREVESNEFIADVVVDSLLRIVILISHNGLFPFNFTSYVLRYKTNGTPDSTFSSDGIYSYTTAVWHALLLQPDGKIVMAGNFNFEKGIVTRLNTNGTADQTFNQGSSNMFSDSYATFYDVSMDAEGRIIACGEIFYFTLLVACFKEGVGLDPDFNGTGEVTIPAIIGSWDQRCAVQPDGKIIAVARTEGLFDRTYGAWRFNKNGTLDTSYDNDGYLEIQSAFFINVGNILCYSDTTTFFSMSYFDGYTYLPVLKKFKKDGAPDNTFGTEGKVTVPFSATEALYPLQCNWMNEDTIVITGAGYTGVNIISTVARLSSSGLLDTAFGDAGFAHLPLESIAALKYILQLQPLNSGKILGMGISHYDPETQKIPLMRFLENGELDSTYGVDGMLELYGYSSLSATVMAKSEDYVFVARAEQLSPFFNTPDDADSIFLSVFRLTADGYPDTSFGVNGRVNPKMQEHIFEKVEDMYIDSSGRILLTGELVTEPSANTNGFVARLNADGTPDSTFGNAGIVVYDLYKWDYFHSVSQQQNNKIIVAAIDSVLHLVVYRLNEDGSPDLLFGSNGMTVLSLDSQISKLRMITLKDDRIFLFLEPNNWWNKAYRFIMLLPDGSPDASFSGDGIAYLKLFHKEYITDMKQVSDGGIVFAGTGSSLSSGWDHDDVLIGKIKTDGTLDESFGNNGIIVYDESVTDNAEDLQLQEDGKIILGGWIDGKLLMIRLLNDSSVATATDQPQIENLLSVFPNPVDDENFVSINSSDPIQQVMLTDMNGRLLKVYHFDDASSNCTISVNDLSKGVYLLSVITQDKRMKQKIIKI